ncbi:MAG: choice-of-anchor Q domain-containing protein [Candidatus Binataceae bacterium]
MKHESPIATGLGDMLSGWVTYMEILDYPRPGGSVSAPRARILRALALLGQAALLVLASSASVRAATITVTTLADQAGTPGTCSLRQAITNANRQNTSGSTNCTAGSGHNDTIVFQSGLTPPTITLGSTLPAIVSGETLTIQGPTTYFLPGITIDGGLAVQLLQVNSGATLNLQFLTLTRGSVTGLSGAAGYGGAIFNNGTVTVTNSTFLANHATGGPGGTDFPGGDGFGGAIANEGTVTVTNSTFSANQATGGPAGSTTGGAGFGGAIYSNGTVTVTNSTFSANQANGEGGGIAEGGGIYNGGTFSLEGTIFAGSTGGNCALPVTDAGYNLSDDESCNFSASSSHKNVMNLNLAGLAENGGPTETIALLTGSAAIDQIPKADCPTTDQRGYVRPAPGQSDCDIGAYELGAGFFDGQLYDGGGIYQLTFPDKTFFGYYSFTDYPYLYHFGLGFEEVYDANDGAAGVYFYDFGLKAFLYTSPSDFPFLHDFSSSSWLYYYVGTSRYFYEFGGNGRGLFFSAPG